MRARRAPGGSAASSAPGLTVGGASALLALATAGSLVLAGCGADASEGAGGPAVERRDSAGVEIVTVGPEDRPLAWSARPVWRLGGAPEGPESFYALADGYVAVDREDRIYVLDAEAGRVVVFDTAGAFLREIGGRGEGPGEMIDPFALGIEGDSVLAAYDFRDRTLERFRLDGTPLGPERPGWLPNPAADRRLRAGEDGWVVHAYASGGDGAESRLLHVGATDSLTLHSAPRPLSSWIESSECGVSLRLPPIFHPELAFDASGGRVVWSGEDRYALRVHEGGEVVQEIRRDLPPRSATREHALAHLGEGMPIGRGGSERCLIGAETLVEGRGHAETLPWIASLDLAPDGTLWVRRFAAPEGERGPVDLFGPDGGYRGTLPPEIPAPIAFLSDGRFLAVEADELDVHRLVLYRIERDHDT